MAFAMIPDPKNPGKLKPFVLSPSNMESYQLCPRRFQGSSITNELPWKASTQKSRGSLVHNSTQKALKHGLQAVSDWPENLDTYFVQEQVQWARQHVAQGAQMFIEHELTINAQMRPAVGGWWDEDAVLRARADTLILPHYYPDTAGSTLDVYLPAELIDIKTGKKWDENDFQLRVEALLVHLIYRAHVVNYNYWYVDIGENVDGSIDFRNGLDPVKDIIDLMNKMKFAITNNYFPATKNRFCKWCAFDKTPKCGA